MTHDHDRMVHSTSVLTVLGWRHATGIDSTCDTCEGNQLSMLLLALTKSLSLGSILYSPTRSCSMSILSEPQHASMTAFSPSWQEWQVRITTVHVTHNLTQKDTPYWTLTPSPIPTPVGTDMLTQMYAHTHTHACTHTHTHTQTQTHTRVTIHVHNAHIRSRDTPAGDMKTYRLPGILVTPKLIHQHPGSLSVAVPGSSQETCPTTLQGSQKG